MLLFFRSYFPLFTVSFSADFIGRKRMLFPSGLGLVVSLKMVNQKKTYKEQLIFFWFKFSKKT
ncbi:hypothetical protein OA84_02105 [Kaistella solincola]|uniref:Uncharacterized protein n=1 Tax=Kaistella solincola TaxID=510955 RepID=A0ABR4ZSV4_9FLAO|nr:hypothetical protein OA84_02105 [Kaistella solincola]